MKIGIICEYNPFHNGHLYHINKIKELYPNSNIILVMSGNVTERGEISILSKWEKTHIALKAGIDLIVELPYAQASQAADIFCYGAINLLAHLKVDKIVFGSEENDIEKLIEAAKIQLYNPEYNETVKSLLNEGLNYPTAMSKALEMIADIKITTPNDILGLGYVKEIIKNNYNIEPVTIQRTNDYHSLNGCSATSIRNKIVHNESIEDLVPNYCLEFLNKKLYFLNDYFPFIKYKILSEDNLDKYQTVDKDIIPRLKKGVIDSNNLDEFILKVKSKYYTYNKLMRMCSHILFSFTKEEASKYRDIQYIRVLGFNNNGRIYLNAIKKELDIPLLTNYSNDANNLLELEIRITRILGILKGKEFILEEYQNKPIMYDLKKF